MHLGQIDQDTTANIGNGGSATNIVADKVILEEKLVRIMIKV